MGKTRLRRKYVLVRKVRFFLDICIFFFVFLTFFSYRDSYPPYGFYILNRMGMKDYIHRLCPEDDIHAHGSYLMIRSYPDFTSERLNTILSSHDTLPEKFADAYAVPNLDKLGHNDKGRSQTVGLWMFATDAREPMIDVMLRYAHFILRKTVG
jgi:hypothetical protein